MLKSLANEQNMGLLNLKAGNYEEAFENFQNVKDEIERLANEKEPNNNDEV